MRGKAASVSQMPTRAERRVSVSTTTEAAPPTFHVLVADGDAGAREAREQQLRGAGFRVALARTGFETIVKASCHLPDLIVLVDSLEDLEATETRRMLATCPMTAHIPVVAVRRGRRVPLRVLSDVRRRAVV